MNGYKFCVSIPQYAGVVFAKTKADAEKKVIEAVVDGSIEDCYVDSDAAGIEILKRVGKADIEYYSVLNPEDGPED